MAGRNTWAKVLNTKNVSIFHAFIASGTCPPVPQAKSVLRDLGANFEAFELDQMGKEGMALRAELAEMTDRTSMPSIWISGGAQGTCFEGHIAPLWHKRITFG